MAKNSVADWSTTAASNTDVGGIDINEGCPAANINNAIRETMAQLKAYSATVPALATVNAYTKIQKWAKGADVASATSLTLGDDGNYFDITGTTTITSIATKGVGTVVLLQFDGALILTHNATDLVLPGGANITTSAGDHAEFVEYATGDWRCTNYTRASENWVDVASATTTDIGAVASQNVRITGTTTITGLGTVAAGTFRRVRFAGALTLTHNATSLILPNARNITTATGDVGEFVSEGSGNWRCVDYQRASLFPGSPLQRQFTSNSSVTAITTVIPIDNTIPQVTEGDEVLTLTMTPSSTLTRFRVRACVIGSLNNAENWTAALFTDASSSAIDAKYAACPSSGFVDQINLEWEWVPGVTTPVKVSVRAGPPSARTLTINASLYGGVLRCTLTLEEIEP